MKRPVLLTLRVLAVGSALTAMTCQVSNRQRQADAGRGAQGTAGPAAPANRPDDAWASSSKIGRVVSPRDVSPAASSPGQKPEPRFMAGTKSAAVIEPSDVRPQAPAPGRQISESALDEVKRRFSRALGFYDLGQFREAEAEAVRILKLDPDNAAAKRVLERCREAARKPAPPPPRFFPGSKSGMVIGPDDVRDFGLQVTPQVNGAAQQQTRRQQ